MKISRDTLLERIEKLYGLLECCNLCPHSCGINRLQGETGKCKTGKECIVASFAPHFGEEAPLVGSRGSGTIFFAQCNLNCIFCQNYELSQGPLTPENSVDVDKLAAIMLSLQNQGCHNINLVTPTHVIPPIVAALGIAVDGGLTIPIVYNCSGYDKLETLQLLDGIIDIYMPDFKFWDTKNANQYTNAPNYPEIARLALKEMFRQVGDLAQDDHGIGISGLIVRHLVMPGGLKESEKIFEFIANELSTTTYINIMDQYHPCGRATEIPPLDRPLARDAYHQALELARKAGLTRLDERDISAILRRLMDPNSP